MCVLENCFIAVSSPMNEIESATQHDEEFAMMNSRAKEKIHPKEVVANEGSITLSAFITLITTSIGIRLNLCAIHLLYMCIRAVGKRANAAPT